VTGGVDTHAEVHAAAVVDEVGRELGTELFPATGAGYRALLSWMRGFGDLERVGVEGTGTYGAGLARFLAAQGLEVREVLRPNRQHRRRRGKSDPADAVAAARAVLAGEADGVAKGATGPAEATRALRVARRSAMKARTQAANQLKNLLFSAPEVLRSRFRGLRADQIAEIASRLRLSGSTDAVDATKAALRSLGRRYLALSAEIAELDELLAITVAQAAPPGLLDLYGVGLDVAGALIVAVGDNPSRMNSERSFAALCGVSQSTHVRASNGVTASTAAATAKPTPLSGGS
jgi:transposase